MAGFEDMIQRRRNDDGVEVTTKETSDVEAENSQKIGDAIKSVRGTGSQTKTPPQPSPQKTQTTGQKNKSKTEGLSKDAKEDSIMGTDKDLFADELIGRLAQAEEFMFEGYAEPEEKTTVEDYKTKTSRWSFNGAEVELDQLTLVYAEKRAKQYLDNIANNAKKANSPIRTFYSDLIMLNLLTNRILKKITPDEIERALNPIRYIQGGDKK